MRPEDAPRDETQARPCRKCDGKGKVLAQIHRLGLSAAGVNFLAIGCPVFRDAEGNSLGREFTCPRCDGSGTDPDPTDPEARP